MINVFEYTDYRLLLRDLYEERKKAQPIFSYRYIGQKVGFSSAGYFSNIIQGRRNISSDLVFKFAELFKFNKRETEYFEALVLYDQSKEHSQKKYHYEKILSMRKSKVGQLSADQYEYFDKWYYVAVRELLNFFPFKGDYQELSLMLRPSITPREAKAAIDLLERLKLVRKKTDGTFEVTESNITSYPNVPLVAVHNFQIAAMDMAKQALDRIPQDKRSISTVSLSCSAETYQAIFERVAALRREIQELVKNDPGKVDRVYQFNFQVYPLTNF